MPLGFPGILNGGWPDPGSSVYGDVDGPGSALDNAVVVFDGTTGKLIKQAGVTGKMIAAEYSSDGFVRVAFLPLATTPTSTNYSIIGNGTDTYVNGPSNLFFQRGTTTIAGLIDASTLRVFGTKFLQFGATAQASIRVDADTTAGVLTFTRPSAGSFSFNGAIAISSPTDAVITFQDNGYIGKDANSNMQFSTNTVKWNTAGANTLTLTGGGSATLTGGAGNMTIAAGTGNSRTMALQTTTSGGVATTALTLSATQDATFAGDILSSKGSAANFGTSSAQNVVLVANSSPVLTGSSTGITIAGAVIGGNSQALSGAGAVDVTHLVTNFTSTGGAQALTLANGTDGQLKIICHVVDGGSGVLTPTTKTGYTTITFTNAGDSVTLKYTTTTGWFIIGIFGAVAA